MRTRLPLLLAVLLLCILLGGSTSNASDNAASAQIVLPAAADVTVRSGSPNTNFGSNDLLSVRYYASPDLMFPYRDATLLQFDMGAVPADAEIDSAILELYLSEVSVSDAVNVGAYFVTSPWHEQTATWTSVLTLTAEPLGVTTPVDGAFGYKAWNLTSYARTWLNGPNQGVVLYGPFVGPNYFLGFKSREAASNQPRLTITYHVPPPPVSDLVMEGLRVQPALAFPGENVTLTADLRNTGPLPYTNVPVRFLRAGAELGVVTVPGLGPGARVNVPFVTSVANLGVHEMAAVANPLHTLPESNPDNNRAVSYLSVVVEKNPYWLRADAALLDLALAPERSLGGAPIEVAARLVNNSRAPLPPIKVALLAGTREVAHMVTPALASGAATPVQLTWSTVEPGRHFLSLVADPDHTLDDRSTDNNSVGGWVRVAGAPALGADVVIEAVRVDTPDPAPGQNVNVEIALFNAGFAPVTNLPVALAIDGRPQGAATVAALAAGERKTVTLTWNGIGPGSHTLAAELDPGNLLNLDSVQRVLASTFLVPLPSYQAHTYATASSYEYGGLWQFVGPKPILAGQAINNGRMDGIAISPQDPDIIAIGSIGSGVWHTDDGGATWQPLTDNLPTPSFARVAIDPREKTTLYALSASGYIYKSSNSGSTWSLFTGPGLPMGGTINNVLLRYEGAGNTLTIYVPSGNGLWVWQGNRAATSGPAAEWRRVWQQTRNRHAKVTSHVSSLVITTESAPQVYIAVQRDSVYRAPLAQVLAAAAGTGTVAWTALDGGLPLADYADAHLGHSPAVANRVFVAVTRDANCLPNIGPTISIYRLDGPATTWTHAGTPTDATKPVHACGIQYNAFLAVHPSKPNILFIGGVTGYRSTNGGGSWSRIENVHADYKDFAFDPLHDWIIYFTSDGGIFRCDEDGADCTSLGSDLETTMFFDVAPGGTAGNKLLIGGTQDNGTLRYDSASLGWKEIHGGDGKYCAIDPANNAIMYAQEQYADSTDKSTDGGAHFADAFAGLPSHEVFWGDPFLVMHPSKPGTLLITAGVSTTQTQVYRSTDSAGSWSPIGPHPDLTRDEVGRLAIDAANDRYYAGARGEIWATTATLAGPGGWTRIYNNDAAPQDVRSLLVDPADPNILYASFRGSGAGRIVRLVHSGGWPGAWAATAIAGGLDGARSLGGGPNDAVRGLALDSTGATTVLLVGTDRGVYQGRLEPGDTTWTWGPDTCGLPRTYVTDIEKHPSGNWIVAATYGRGAYVRPTGSTSRTPDLYDKPQRNDTFATARPLPAMQVTSILQPGLSIADLNMDRPTDIDFFTVTLPPAVADECLAAGDPSLSTPRVHQCLFSIYVRAPDTPDPFEVALYLPTGARVTAPALTAWSLGAALARPRDLFPNGVLTFSVRGLTGCRNDYELVLTYNTWYMERDAPGLLYDPPLVKVVLPELYDFPWHVPGDPVLDDRGFLGAVDPIPDQRALFWREQGGRFAADLLIEGGKTLGFALLNDKGQVVAEGLPVSAGAEAGGITVRRIEVESLPPGWYALSLRDGAFPTWFRVQVPGHLQYLPMINR